MARVVTLNAFGQKPLSATLTPTRERGASAFGAHARPETVLLLARSFGWLISAFHKAENSRRRELRAVILGTGTPLSNL